MTAIERLSIDGGRLRRGGRTLAASITLDLAMGESAAILGASGVGKSSLLHALAGDEGARLDQVRWSAQGGAVARPVLGFITQPNPIPPWMPAGAFLSAHWSHASNRSQSFQRHASEACELVGLSFGALRRQLGRELSHGMQSRLALAAVLLLDAQVNLLDEPFSGVDEALRWKLLPLIKQRLAGPGRLLLVVTHSPMEALFLASRIMLMQPGKGLIEMAIPGGAERDSFLPANEAARRAYQQIFQGLGESAQN
jgi:thiamine transport system ATP-binding protein